MGENGFQQLIPKVGEVVKEAEKQGSAALSYTWSNDPDNVASEPYDYFSLVNHRWLDLMLKNGQDGAGGGSPAELGLIPLPPDQIPNSVRQFLAAQLPLWSRDQLTGADALSQLSFYHYSGPTRFPMALGGTLVFSNNALIAVPPTLYDTFNDDFLASAASTSNVVFTGLGRRRRCSRSTDSSTRCTSSTLPRMAFSVPS